MTAADRVGFMQGRLSPLVNGRIQAFPWQAWKDEFRIAEQGGFRLMEWTLDQDDLYDNPLLTRVGQEEIRALSARHGIDIPSLTGDCFMQAPFWKSDAEQRMALEDDFRAIVEACSSVGIRLVVLPLVDNGRLAARKQEDALVEFLEGEEAFLAAKGIRVVFESDFAPHELARFIDRLTPEVFGINYDIGNSAALGFDVRAELAAYGARIVNVHVKDRVLGGTTVPLGTGSADFGAVFSGLARIGYRGNVILQTARAADGRHAEALSLYRRMVLAWMQEFGLEAEV